MNRNVCVYMCVCVYVRGVRLLLEKNERIRFFNKLLKQK